MISVIPSIFHDICMKLKQSDTQSLLRAEAVSSPALESRVSLTDTCRHWLAGIS